MQDLIKQEQFEIEVLDRLRTGKFLDALIFTRGTMLRLCYGLNRFSVDLDFWFYKKDVDVKEYFLNSTI
jgi:predicted nucleotidyltransferase component of viral defense system